jgi:hypothetical protein
MRPRSPKPPPHGGDSHRGADKGTDRAVACLFAYLRLCPLATRGEWIFTWAPFLRPDRGVGRAGKERRTVLWGDVQRRPIISCASAFSLDPLPLPCAGFCYPPPADTLCLYTLAAWFRFLTPNVL